MWDAFTTTGPGLGGSVVINGVTVRVGGSAAAVPPSNQTLVSGSGVSNTGSGGGGGGSYDGRGGNGSSGRCIIKILT